MEARHSQILLFQKITFVSEVYSKSSGAFEGVSAYLRRLLIGLSFISISIIISLMHQHYSNFKVLANETHQIPLELDQRARSSLVIRIVHAPVSDGAQKSRRIRAWIRLTSNLERSLGDTDAQTMHTRMVKPHNALACQRLHSTIGIEFAFDSALSDCTTATTTYHQTTLQLNQRPQRVMKTACGGISRISRFMRACYDGLAVQDVALTPFDLFLRLNPTVRRMSA
ncbi:hypothetical protein SISNIDRAFT_468304 [Sistotremastrum niveocremeum HHB9708]|uniref:Uncharacterized protein n=1 Tax=Sistotremastrum niveocremeum HHB9708 TaxID=1314777 RepID=A0A164RR26_9AGAM|nr:hypothetical protein SISNIDRAFT_468304 [Sistotremastrum niveocremeum HHB9708]